MTNKEIAKLGVLIASIELGLDGIEVEFRGESFFKRKTINAVFFKEVYTIVFNEDLLEFSHEDNILKCAFHETRHAYQMACIEFPELMNIDVSDVEVEIWKSEFECYFGPGDELYETQLIELDAVRFAEELFNDLYGDE
ncbi:hypothetical protein LJC17_03075 [Acholeplasma sp. OttesenSCG-928-E16]|nr:hypothetical protein [Acholeplasma sp. OttesenSCG-928-E16]